MICHRVARGKARVRWAAPIVAIAALVVVPGCTPEVRVAPESAASDVGRSTGSDPANPGSNPGAAPSAAAGELPNGVPLPGGGLIVSGPTAAKGRSGVTGWSAVVTLSASEQANPVRDALRGQLSYLGWQVAVGSSKGETAGTLSARRILPAGAPGSTGGIEQWLQVTVTDPLMDSGPAVVYRFAEAAQ